MNQALLFWNLNIMPVMMAAIVLFDFKHIFDSYKLFCCLSMCQVPIIAANCPKSPPKNQFLFHTLSPILGMGSSCTTAMAQKRSINSAGRRQCHFKLLKMALSSTSRVNRSFLSHCCSAAGSHSKNGTQP